MEISKKHEDIKLVKNDKKRNYSVSEANSYSTNFFRKDD